MKTSRRSVSLAVLLVAAVLIFALVPGCGSDGGLRERRAQREEEGRDEFERFFNLEPDAGQRPQLEREASVYQFEVERDIPYYQGPGYDASMHLLDLYIPQGAGSYPSVVFVHGGSWKFGDKDDEAGTSRAFAEALAGQGIGVASINYRLYPQVTHPEQVKDVARAFSWTVGNISRYGGDPGLVFLSGHSAGGHLAALAALDGGYLEEAGVSPSSVKGSLVISGLYDLPVLQEKSPRYSEELLAVFGSDAAVLKDASPQYHIRPDAPPFLILYADRDVDLMAEQAGGFFASLRAAGVDVQLYEESGRSHITIVSYMGTVDDAATSQACAFISGIAGNPQ